MKSHLLSFVILLCVFIGNSFLVYADETFDVTYYVAGVKNVVQRSSGDALNLPSPSSCGTMSFYGWSTTFDAESPNFVENTMTVSEDMTLHAVFLKSVSYSCYARVIENQVNWEGQYLIARNRIVANGKKGDDTEGGIGYGENIGFPKNYDAVNDALPISFGDSYYITLEVIDESNLSSGYLMKTQDGKYNYTNSKSSGINTSSTRSTAEKYSISISFNSESDIRLKIGTMSFQLKGSAFKFCSDGTEYPVCLYKRTTYPNVYSLGLPETVTISSAKYATYATNRALDFSATGVTAYTANVVGDVVKLSPVEDGIVPANTGVILYKDVEESEDIEIPFVVTEKVPLTNELVGTTERVSVAKESGDGRYNYILQRSGDRVVFNMAKESGAWMPANRAYLSTTVCASESRLTTVFEDEETSRISVPSLSESVEMVYYNLSGQRVVYPHEKGIYIVCPAGQKISGGKKFFIR
jgi:hypothetical protein